MPYMSLHYRQRFKFDANEIKPELVAFMYPDPLGLKTEALYKMAGILREVADELPVTKPIEPTKLN